MFTSESIVILGLLAIILILLIWIVCLELRLQKLFRGRKAVDLETIITDIGKAIDGLLKKSDKNEAGLKFLDQKISKTIGKFYTVRFNPFKDQGGNQSFATCLMDDNGDGVVLSSLYSRDKVSVYAKPVTNYESQYELIEEEIEAIAQAKKR